MQPTSSWIWFALGSAGFAGLTAILGKIGVTGLNSNFATFFRTVVVLAVTAAIVTWRGEWKLPEPLAARPLLFLALSGVATGLSWLCYYRALQLAPASLVAPVDKLSVVFAMSLGVLVLGEPFGWRLAAGGALIVAGVLVMTTGS